MKHFVFLLGCCLSLVLAGSLVFAESSLAKKDCELIRGALDIGSSSTKLNVAAVDVCAKIPVLKYVLHKESIRVGYRDDLKTSLDGSLSTAVRRAGIAALNQLRDKAKSLGVTQFHGLATEVFRQAKNGEQFIRQIESETGIDVTLSTAEVEAKVGLAGAMAHERFRKETSLVVWDIGSSSMQLIAQDAGAPAFHSNKMASDSMKYYILRFLQKKNLHETSSPNPIGEKHLFEASRFAESFSSITIPDVWVKYLRHKKPTVVGIGPLHYYGICARVSCERTYSKAIVEKAMREMALLTDGQIGGDFADVTVGNLALIHGIMSALGIESVNVINISLAEGLLVTSSLWRE